MPQFLNAVFSWFFNKDEKEKEQKTYYIKSLLYLGVIILFICNYFHDTTNVIIEILGNKILHYVSLFLIVGLDFFSVLCVMAIVIWFISLVLSVICEKLSDNKIYDYFLRMCYGSKHRLINCVENVTLMLLMAYLIDYSVFQQYKAMYSDNEWMVFCVILAVTFMTTSIKGILNRFFVLWPHENAKSKNLILEQLVLLTTENQNLKEELAKYK